MLIHHRRSCLEVVLLVAISSHNIDSVLAYLSYFATLKLFKMGPMGQINDPCPSSTGATHFVKLIDCCVNGPWCWQWPLDEVRQSKATIPAVPPFSSQKMRVGEHTCSSIPWWLRPSHAMHLHSECEPCSWLLFVFNIVIRYLPPHSTNFSIPKFIQFGPCGSNKWSQPIIPRRYMFLWTKWLLWRWTLVSEGHLGCGTAI